MAKEQHILAGHLIDGTGGAVQKSVCLVVAGGVIMAIKKQNECLPAQHDELIDLSHCTLLPPLVDCSLRLSCSAADERICKHNTPADYIEAVKKIQQNTHFCYSHGILGVVDNGDDGHVVRYCEEAGSLPLEIVTSTAHSMGSGDCLRLCNSLGVNSVADEADFSALHEKNKLAEIIKKNSSRVTIVAANGEIAVKDALDAGCRAIEQGYFMGPSNLEQMARNEVVWIPTFLQVKNGLESAFGKRKSYLQRTLKNQLDQMRLARQFGVKTALGTCSGSSGIIHGDAMVEEIKLYLKSGLSLTETLKCASINGAELVKMKNVGLLKVGKMANFLVTRGVVQQLPRKLSYLENIYHRGLPSDTYRKNPVKIVHKK